MAPFKFLLFLLDFFPPLHYEIAFLCKKNLRRVVFIFLHLKVPTYTQSCTHTNDSTFSIHLHNVQTTLKNRYKSFDNHYYLVLITQWVRVKKRVLISKDDCHPWSHNAGAKFFLFFFFFFFFPSGISWRRQKYLAKSHNTVSNEHSSRIFYIYNLLFFYFSLISFFKTPYKLHILFFSRLFLLLSLLPQHIRARFSTCNNGRF